MMMIPDYKFILIDPHQMSEDDFERMNTNLKSVLRAIAYARHKNKIQQKLAFPPLDRFPSRALLSLNLPLCQFFYHNMSNHIGKEL